MSLSETMPSTRLLPASTMTSRLTPEIQCSTEFNAYINFILKKATQIHTKEQVLVCESYSSHTYKANTQIPRTAH